MGHFIYHHTLTAERYLNLLENQLEESLDIVPLQNAGFNKTLLCTMPDKQVIP